MLPLALSASMVLLLSSLSLQTAALQSRRRDASQQRRLAAQDALVSAAQLVVGRLQNGQSCLLGQPLTQWTATVGCGSNATLDLASLLEGTLPEPVANGTYTLLSYSVQTSAGTASAGSVPSRGVLDIRWQPADRLSAAQRQRFWLDLEELTIAPTTPPDPAAPPSPIRVTRVRP